MYKDIYPDFALRKEDSATIKAAYPNHNPIICERSDSNAIEINKRKFLVSKTMRVCDFAATLRARMHMKKHEALYLYAGSTLLRGESLIANLYCAKKDPDGFLYLTY